MKTAICPGSFDPLHNGHLEIIDLASRIFERVVVAAVHNPAKGEPLFTLDERLELIREATAHLPNVEAVAMTKLTVDVAADVGADVIVKGLRVASDFEYELQQAQMNRALSGILTVFLPCGSSSSFIASSLVRQIARYGGADRISAMVPEPVAKRLQERLRT